MNTHSATSELSAEATQSLRVDLAAAFRLAARFDWHELVGNHFSAAISADGKKFLMNPRWRHFGEVRASDLVALDADDSSVMARSDAPDPSAWTIHGSVHGKRPDVRVMLHCHPPYATTLACLEDPEMKPVDQNTARFFGKLGIDLGFGGIADDAAEGQRLAAAFGNKSVIIMGNHGVRIAGTTKREICWNSPTCLHSHSRIRASALTCFACCWPMGWSSPIIRSTDAWQGFGLKHWTHS